MYSSSSTTSTTTGTNITSSSSSTTDNACKQRKINMLFNIPPVRLEKAKSPYPTYTSQQLNMRRKVEILKYKKNSTQGNRLTSKQK